MPTLNADALLGAIFERGNLGAFDVFHNCGRDLDLTYCGSSNHDDVLIKHQEDAFKVKFFAHFMGKAIHINGGAFDGAVLLAATFNNSSSHYL